MNASVTKEIAVPPSPFIFSWSFCLSRSHVACSSNKSEELLAVYFFLSMSFFSGVNNNVALYWPTLFNIVGHALAKHPNRDNMRLRCRRQREIIRNKSFGQVSMCNQMVTSEIRE